MRQFFYSPEAKGFYVEGIHVKIPADSIPLTEEEYAALLQAQTEGREIVHRAGRLQTQIRKLAASWDIVRQKRDSLLESSDWTMSLDSPLDDSSKEAWRSYRQKLRDITTTYNDAGKVVWPPKPDTSS